MTILWRLRFYAARITMAFVIVETHRTSETRAENHFTFKFTTRRAVLRFA